MSINFLNKLKMVLLNNCNNKITQKDRYFDEDDIYTFNN